MTDRSRDIQALLARHGLTEDLLLGFVEDTLPPGEAAGIVESIAVDAELGDLVWSMRRDRRALAGALAIDRTTAAPDWSAIDQAVTIGVTGEIPADLARELEETGIGKTGPRPNRVRTGASRGRSIRVPASGRRLAVRGFAGTLAACLLVGVAWVMIDAWPDTSRTAVLRDRSIAGVAPSQPEPSPTRAGAMDRARSDALAFADLDDAPAAEGLAFGLSTAGRSMLTDAERIEDPAAMLAAAREGRLILRVVSADAHAALEAVESITTQPSVARVAVLEGAMDRDAGLTLAGALPASGPPVYASERTLAARAARTTVSFDGAYMLRVEPTERGLGLLVAGLGRDARVSVQAIRSAEPVTTPGRVADLIWFRSPSRTWQPRVSAPVVIETVR
ncbi:MAG: hypothetical protein AAGB48_07140 [Planctomycetota bacterium]